MNRSLVIVFLLTAGVSNAAVISGQLETTRDQHGYITGNTIDYIGFTVSAADTVVVDMLSFDYFPNYFDPWIWLFEDDGRLGPEDLIRGNDDSWAGRDDGSVRRLDSYLERVLQPGDYILAVDSYPSALGEVASGFASRPDQRMYGGADFGEYQLTVTGGGVSALEYVSPDFEPVRGPFVRFMGDINGDFVNDIAMIDREGSIRIRDFNNSTVSSWFTGFGNGQIVDVEVMRDSNGNGTPELALFHSGKAPNDVIDSLTAESLIKRRSYNGLDGATDLELLADIDGDGVPELASLTTEKSVVKVRGLFQNTIAYVPVSTSFLPQDLEVWPDRNGDGVQELAVLAQNKEPGRPGKLDVRNPLNGQQLWRLKLSSQWNALQQELVADLDGDNYDEVAILRTHKDSGEVHVVMFGTSPAQVRRGQLPFDSEFKPAKLLVLADINANGAEEIAVVGQSDDGRIKAQIKDSKTQKYIRSVFFDSQSVLKDVSMTQDLNGNGSDELIVLVESSSGRRYRAIVKDSKTGARLATVRF